MHSTLSSVADFDLRLTAEYMRFRQSMLDEPEHIVQRRFAQHAIFPALGWSLLGVGEREAISSRSPAPLYGSLSRFLRCAHHCWAQADEKGVHWGGYDHCALVVHSLYSASISSSYAKSAFHCRRPLSRNGYGAYVHGANLMTSIECSTWPFKEKAVAGAQSFVSSKGRTTADRAFVRFLLGVVERERAVAGDALGKFADEYLKSDWGRHKPWTKSALIQSMLAYANNHLSEPVEIGAHRAFLSAEQVWVWTTMRQALGSLEQEWRGFSHPLNFLNDP